MRALRGAALAGVLASALAGPAVSHATTHRHEGGVGVTLTTHGLAARLRARPALRWHRGVPRGARVIRVDDRAVYQRMDGFGAAMTDSSAWLMATRLAPYARAKLMSDFFGLDGLRLNAVRTPMGASDFTRNGIPYSYDDTPFGLADPAMALFSVDHDRAYVLPLLREVRRLNPRAAFMANPWSPPAWMKRNNSSSNAHGAGTLRDGTYRPLATYFVRFLQAYAAAGVPIASITPQNEPGLPTLYPGLDLSPSQEARFVGDYLAPALRSAQLHPAIYGLDHNWASRLYAHGLLKSPRAAAALAGIAWHCYHGDPRAMSELHRLAPRLKQAVSECATPIAPEPTAELVIASARNWASTVQLWNLALDGHTGPVQAPNHGCSRCRGLVEIDPTGRVTRGRDFYELEHASRFVAPGASRIGSNTFVSYRASRPGQRGYVSRDVDNVAFRNPDGRHVLLLYNNAPVRRSLLVTWRGRSVRYALPGRAAATLTWSR